MTARCSDLSLEAGERPGGTAGQWRASLLIEENGLWGPKILRESRLSPALRAHLDLAGLRVLLIRRHGRRTEGTSRESRAHGGSSPHGGSERSGVRVLASWSDHQSPWVEMTTLRDLEDLLEVDVAPLVIGKRPGWTPVEKPVVLVCTHGRRDVCCAERGRPVAAVLAAHDPEGTWECSHVGGHRFAANVVVLPDGLVYGRVPPADAVDVIARWHIGRVEPSLMRGWVWQEPAVQAAEVAVRQRFGLRERDDVRVSPVQATDDDEGRPKATDAIRVQVEISEGAYAGRHVVHVRAKAPTSADGDFVEVLASCGDEHPMTASGWRVGALQAL